MNQNFVDALCTLAEQRGWASPLYEKLDMGERYFNVRILVGGKSYMFRSCYKTYEEAKQSVSKTVFERLSSEKGEGGIPKAHPKIDAILAAHRTEGQMTPDTSSSSQDIYSVIDEEGIALSAINDFASIWWMLIQEKTPSKLSFLQRIVSGVLWLIRRSHKHIALYVEEEVMVPLQVILLQLGISHAVCGNRYRAIEIHLE